MRGKLDPLNFEGWGSFKPHVEHSFGDQNGEARHDPTETWAGYLPLIPKRAMHATSFGICASERPCRSVAIKLPPEAIYWAAQQGPDGEYIKRWVPELQSLDGTLASEPWRVTSEEPESAARVGSAPEEWPPAVSRECERIGWARRTFPAGGSQVAVWWGCMRDAGKIAPRPEAGKAEGAGASAERRLDPDDGKEYSLEGLKKKYKGQYKLEEIRLYWQDTCEPLEIRTDPEDGKAYTLAELHAKYRKQYTWQEVAKYFKSSCVRLQERASTIPRAQATGWPEGYPLPLLPPASFFCIEEIAEHSRRGQARKAAKAARLWLEIGGDGSGGRTRGPYGTGSSKSEHVASEEREIPKSQKGPRRWAKTAPQGT